MGRRVHTPVITVWEALLVVVVIAVMASIFWPIRHGHEGEKVRQTMCTSQLRLIATALQMYAQDNANQYPGAGMAGKHWDTRLNAYVGSWKTYYCPSSAHSDPDQSVSYGYNGLLVRMDGTGINAEQVRMPTEVGAFCDAAPCKTTGNGGLVNGGALLDPQIWNVNPEERHARGLVMAYADGHAKYIPRGVQAGNLTNPVTRAFYLAGVLGLVDNPGGGVEGFSRAISKPETSRVTFGGDFCTRPILLAAAEAWKRKTDAGYATRGFHGQYATKGRPATYVWGIADGRKPVGHSYPIARDAVVVIVNKQCKINWTRDGHHLPIANQMTKGTYWATSAQIVELFGADAGRARSSCVAYTYDANSGTRRFFTQAKWWGKPLTIGPKAVTVADDWRMVDKVATDPCGVGYCSLAMADLARVRILAIGDGTPAHTIVFPTSGRPGRWPLARTLYVECGGKAWGPNGIADTMFKPGAPGKTALHNGPLFKASYWPE